MRPVTQSDRSHGRQTATSRQSGAPKAAASQGIAGKWNRLKPPPEEPLQAYGFPSKGETRLNDFKNQEAFYHKIVERYLTFCATTTVNDSSDTAVRSLPLHSSRWATVTTPATLPSGQSSKTEPSTPHVATSGKSVATCRPDIPTIKNIDSSPEMQMIHIAMRKLREGIVASRRRDNFAQRAEIFIIRATVFTKSWESYHPALLHLLSNIHPYVPLPSPELHEFVLYYILDLACRQNDMSTAYRMKLAYSINDRRLDATLKSLVEDNWLLFWKTQRLVDGYQEALMSHAEERMRLHSLQCLGRTYFTVEKSFVEKTANKDWDKLVKAGIGWKLEDGNKIVIRKPKGA